MSLRRKTLVIIGATLISLIVALYILSQVILLVSYERLEKQSVERNVERAINAINDEIAVLHATNLDWGHWNDTYQFIEDRNQEYLDGNTYDGSFSLYGWNFMLHINTEGEIVFQKGFDLNDSVEVPIPEGLQPYLVGDSILLDHTNDAGELNMDGVSGFLLLPEGPVMVASTPILPTDLNGSSRGSLIFGRFLDDEEITSLSEKTRLNVTSLPFKGTDLPPDFQAARVELSRPGSIQVNALSSDNIAGYTTINDIHGDQILLLRVDMPRDIYQQGQASLSYFLISLVILGIVFVGATLVLLERVVLSRLAYLNDSVSHIRTGDDLSTRISMTGQDELSNLTHTINDMLEALSHAQDELMKARDQALEASRLKSQILANVSHDARTPLSVIILRTETLQAGLYGSVSETQNRMLQSINASAQQLLGFITNLLQEAQLNAGTIQLHNVDFAPNTLTKAIETSITPLAARKDLYLKTEIDDDVPDNLVGDPDRLNQILSNLIGNAIKFTNEGGITLRIRRPDMDHWSMEVSDTGIGIPADVQERIFEAFWQVDGSSTRTVTTGVGLGLSIVKQLTALMDGRVALESKPGMGSKFTIILPLVAAEGEPADEQIIRVDR